MDTLEENPANPTHINFVAYSLNLLNSDLVDSSEAVDEHPLSILIKEKKIRITPSPLPNYCGYLDYLVNSNIGNLTPELLNSDELPLNSFRSNFQSMSRSSVSWPSEMLR